MKASIIIPVWNRHDLTQAFLYHNWRLYQAIPSVEFVVIDNGSTDVTYNILEQWLVAMGRRLTIIRNEENQGFGPANNQGAEVAKGDCLVFLSNDVTPTGCYVEPILAQAQDNTLLGAQEFAFDTGWNKFGNEVIPYLAGWCIAANRQTWDKLGGWDERFIPSDYEDIDLSYRARKAGMSLIPLQLPLIHQSGQSAINTPGGREEAATKPNRQRFMDKWSLSL